MLPIEQVDIRPAMKLITEETGVQNFVEVLQKMERYSGTMQQLDNLKMSLEGRLEDLVMRAYNLQRELTADVEQAAKRKVNELRDSVQKGEKESGRLRE